METTRRTSDGPPTSKSLGTATFRIKPTIKNGSTTSAILSPRGSQLMAEGGVEPRIAEAVAALEQSAGLDPSAGEQERIGHFAERRFPDLDTLMNGMEQDWYALVHGAVPEVVPA
jgi:hypothetical protein